MNDELGATIACIETVIDDMQRVRALQSVEARREIVALRRQLFNAFAALGPAYRSGGSGGGTSDQEFDGRLAAVRHAIALHQSSWPAVLLDERTPEYLASADAVRGQIRDILDWIARQSR